MGVVEGEGEVVVVARSVGVVGGAAVRGSEFGYGCFGIVEDPESKIGTVLVWVDLVFVDWRWK